MNIVELRNGLSDNVLLKKTSEKSKDNTRNPDLPTIYIPIPGNFLLNVANRLVLRIGERITIQGNTATLTENIKGLCNLYYGRYVQNTGADYTTEAYINKFTVKGNSLFEIGLAHRETIEGNQNSRIGQDQKTTILGSEYLNIGKDFKETIEGTEVSDARKNFIISVGGPNLVYTRKDEILDIGGQEKLTIVGSQKYYIGRSDNIMVKDNSYISVKKDFEDDISGNQILKVGDKYLLDIGLDNKNIVQGIFTMNVGANQDIAIRGSKQELIAKKYNLTTPKFNIDSDVQVNGSLSGTINGEINLVNVNAGEVIAGRWLPIPWSSVNSVNNPGIRFDQSSNKFIVEKEGNYSFNSFVDFNLVNSIAITRIRFSCCCGEKVLLGSNVTKYLTTSFVRGTTYLKANTCIYFEYISSTSSMTGFGPYEQNKVISSLTISKL